MRGRAYRKTARQWTAYAICVNPVPGQAPAPGGLSFGIVAQVQVGVLPAPSLPAGFDN